jgi:hypothetical protein
LTLANDRWPSLIVAQGPRAEERFLEFFTAQIRNKNTREAYFRAVSRFFDWCQNRGLALGDIRPVHVATYIEGFTVGLSDPSTTTAHISPPFISKKTHVITPTRHSICGSSSAIAFRLSNAEPSVAPPARRRNIRRVFGITTGVSGKY